MRINKLSFVTACVFGAVLLLLFDGATSSSAGSTLMVSVFDEYFCLSTMIVAAGIVNVPSFFGRSV